MPQVKSPTLTAAKLAANRRNAQKSTGPRTRAGKRRVALNARSRDLCPQELERELRARGEDSGEFRRLHRDLISIFRPQDVAGVGAVEWLARTWWEKARRIRRPGARGGPGRAAGRVARVSGSGAAPAARGVATSAGFRPGAAAGGSWRREAPDRVTAVHLRSQAGKAEVPSGVPEKTTS